MKIEGTVVHGRRLGHVLGFPTANLRVEAMEGDGKDGVYAGWFRMDGKCLPCMFNIGAHPTLPGGGRSVEAHIFNFDGDIYGRRATLEAVGYLRAEMRFSDVDKLREQLSVDRERSLQLLCTEATAEK